jgi:hypothetical protein
MPDLTFYIGMEYSSVLVLGRSELSFVSTYMDMTGPNGVANPVNRGSQLVSREQIGGVLTLILMVLVFTMENLITVITSVV